MIEWAETGPDGSYVCKSECVCEKERRWGVVGGWRGVGGGIKLATISSLIPLINNPDGSNTITADTQTDAQTKPHVRALTKRQTHKKGLGPAFVGTSLDACVSVLEPLLDKAGRKEKQMAPLLRCRNWGLLMADAQPKIMGSVFCLQEQYFELHRW